RRIAEALALEQALAEPILHIGRKPIARVFAQEGAEAVVGERVVLAHQVTVGEVVIVLGTVRWRQRRDLGAGRARIAPRRRLIVRRPSAERRERRFDCRSTTTQRNRQVERRAGRASAGSTDRRLLDNLRPLSKRYAGGGRA